MAELIYGAGLRIFECMSLRVKDVDFDLRSITVRAAKGHNDRVTLLPESLVIPLQNHLLTVPQMHKSDVLKGNGFAPMPNAPYKKIHLHRNPCHGNMYFYHPRLVPGMRRGKWFVGTLHPVH